MDVEVNDYREFFERKYFVEFDDGNRSIYDAEKCLVRIGYGNDDDDFSDEVVMTHEEIDEFQENSTEWKGYEISSIEITNSIHLDGSFFGF